MYKLLLSLRYMFKRRITYLATVSVALCVFMAIVVITVMTGLLADFKDKNHKWSGDCIISTDSLVGFAGYEEFSDILSRTSFVSSLSPVIRSYAILSAKGSDRNTTIEISGIDPASFGAVTDFANMLHYHKGDPQAAFEPPYDPNLPGCVLGIDMALARDQYGKYIHSDQRSLVAFEISCFPLTAKGALAKAGLGLVSSKTFYYSDDCHSGLAKVDGSFVYLPFNEAQRLCGMDGDNKRVTAIHIKFIDGTDIEQATGDVKDIWNDFVSSKEGTHLASLLGNVRVETWKEFNRDSIAAVETEQVMMIFSFLFIGVISVFIVFVVFYMIVSHKSKDIGILKSIGISKLNIIAIFLYFAFFVGSLASLLGVFAGVIFLSRINQLEGWLYDQFGFQLWNRMIYAIDLIPNQINITVLIFIVVLAIFACLAGAFIPACQAAKMQPVNSLQVNQL